MPDENDPKRFDIQEIVNYRRTLAASVQAIKEKPFHLNMVKALHGILMDSVRGQNHRPGDFRTDQNWIGPKDCSIDQAYFVPPEPITMGISLDNWEKYWHHFERDPLVQLAIIHAQFEIIHPFRDGNGRIGRVLIPLFLLDKGLLTEPVFYLSEYFESNRDGYYGGLRSISDTGKWETWLDFFLKAIAQQAIAIRCKAEKIIELYESMKLEIYNLNTSYGLPALDTLFHIPIFASPEFGRFSSIPKASANRLLHQLERKGLIKILVEGQGRRPNTYVFEKLIVITETPLESQA